MKMAEEFLENIHNAGAKIADEINGPIEVLFILGTGLGGIVEHIETETVFEYRDIPGFPLSTAPSHAGRLIIGTLGGLRTAIMQGRLHLYEGWSPADIGFPIRVSSFLGAKKLLVTNAAGSLNSSFNPGDVMMIKDHINFTGQNPLIGPHNHLLGARFPDMSDAYDRKVQAVVRAAFQKHNIILREGIYAGITGPSLETSAERRYLHMCGGDAVGMSTVLEVIVAKQCGFEIAGLSAISNKADGGPNQKPDTIEKVLEFATESGSKILKVLPDLIKNWSNATKGQ